MAQAITVLPDGWPRPRGYSNGVILPEGQWLCVAGMVGWDKDEKIVSDSFAEQFEQALINIKEVVEAAGTRIEFVGRLRIFVASKQDYISSIEETGAAYRRVFGKHFPAMALVEVSALLEPGALVEIEADAVIPRG